jgi:hypothetical protein
LAADSIVLVYLLRFLWNNTVQFIREPGLPDRVTDLLRELLESIGYLGLCCSGIVIAIIIVGKIPYKWWHGGVEAPVDDDDDPYYRYM